VPGGEFPKVIIDPNERCNVRGGERTGERLHIIGAAVELLAPFSCTGSTRGRATSASCSR